MTDITPPIFDQKKLPPQVRQLTALFYQMGYQFSNINLPILALMHRSYDSEHNYERLEFLGDALLGVVIAEALFQRNPTYNEGQLTRMRATLVREATLVIIAKNLKLSDYLILGVGERKGGGRQRASILADAVEALIGAIYLDSGDFNTVKACVLAWFSELFDKVDEQKVLKDGKSRLQELLQAHQIALPRYELIDTLGNAPNQTFIVDCHVNFSLDNQIFNHKTNAQGESRRIAEQRCAELMLLELTKQLN
ncbi:MULTISPECIES: ribonuclease III [unclassified Moraxella]|uniref:ribonuclease III n=1 Tax=unclassified Moraxella TaxID=2685852 RepID=UPI003AF645CA